MTSRKSLFNKSILKVDKNRPTQSCNSISKREISLRNGNSIEQCRAGSRLVQTNKATPRPPKEEINQMAKAWCELMLNQMQETQYQSSNPCH